MEYLEPLPTCDKILELFTPEQTAGLTHSGILDLLKIKHGTPEAGFVASALEQLKKDELIIPYGMNDSYFKVGGNTFIFKGTQGYKGKIERDIEIEKAKNEFEKMSLKSSQSVIETNLSIQSLNTKTDIFYTHQTKYNKAQKLLTIAILLLHSFQRQYQLAHIISLKI